MSTNLHHLNQIFLVILGKAAEADWLSANSKCFSCIVMIVPNLGNKKVIFGTKKGKLNENLKSQQISRLYQYSQWSYDDIW